jgi:hypothetical protein
MFGCAAADHQRIAKLDRDDAPKPPEKVDMSCFLPPQVKVKTDHWVAQCREGSSSSTAG